MSQRKAKGCLIASLLWCVILVILGAAYKFLVHPSLSKKLTEETGSASQYRETVRLAADSFSGYAIFRSDRMKETLRQDGIKLDLHDDGADYEARIEALRNGETDLAVFTIDSYLAAGTRAGDFPGSIVLIIDETKGGDAIVAKPSAIQSLQDLNDPNARIVFTANSPSEFLARVVLAHFNLPDLPENWAQGADGPQAVLRAAQEAGSTDKRAFVLWEPYVARAVNDHGHRILLDSSKLEGYIVDVLVKTQAIPQDPLAGRYHTLFYQKTLSDLKADGFHPSRKLTVVAGLGSSPESVETVRVTEEAKAISETEWTQLRPVGELSINPLVFVRGSANISITSRRDLSAVAKKLKSFPEFYVRLIGQTRSEGDTDANRRLAEQRATAVSEQLIAAGIGSQRIRTEATPSIDRAGAAQSVRFVVGQLPY